MTLLYNIGIDLLELVYIFSIAVAMDMLVDKKLISKNSARKVIHLWFGGLIFFWFAFNSAYSQLLFIFPLLVFVAAMLTALSEKAGHSSKVLKFVRMDNLYEVVYGPFLFVLMFIVFTMIAFKSIGGVAALCAMTFGDGVAPIVGRYARMHYLGGKKSVEGSIAFFAGSFLSMFIFFLIFFPSMLSSTVIIVAAAASIMAALTEAVTPGNYDNLSVPFMAWGVFLGIGL